ncbi:head-to-tail adaptor [Arthrobacter phage Atuin]|nr:head-to-tail adaptor [Arthrobacter phage Atuin]
MSGPWITAADTIAPTGPYTESAVATASWILFKLSGEKYTGISTSTEAYNSSNYTINQPEPVVFRGTVYNMPPAAEGFRNLRLRHSPIVQVLSVEQLGEILDPSEYTLRNNAYLVRKNSLPWVLDPVNDLTITYRHGTPPPAAGRRAALRLANEFILADMGSSACALPERISSVQRQGVSYTIMDPQEFISNGKVGIYEIDLFLAAANPNKAKKKPKIFSVDKPRGERIT